MKFKQLTQTHPAKYNSLALFSDSQAALDLLAKPMIPKTLQYLARFLTRTQTTIGDRFDIRLYWTPGHEGVNMNERADEAAKGAAEDQTDSITLPISLGCLLRHTRDKIQNREAVPSSPYKTKKKYIADALNQLEKSQAAAIFQLRCGHCPLKKFLHRIGAEDDDRCEICRARETPAHFLIYCRRYKAQRQELRKKLREEEIKVDTNSATKLLDSPKAFPYLAKFIQDTGRFIHVKTYIEEPKT